MNEEIYEELQKVARAGDVTYYGVIAPLADLDMGLDRDRAEIGRLLGEISTHEHEHGRHLLSAIVVHSRSFPIDALRGRPGRGVYPLTRELRLLQPGQDEDTYWQDEVRHVLDYWQAH